MGSRGSVLVTGGRRRLGQAMAETLRAHGWNVLVHSREAADPLAADFTDPLAPARLFQKACDLAPDLCALVNNAAVFSPRADLPPDEAARMMRVNAEAPEKLATLLGLRLMEHAPFRGSVVHLLDARILPWIGRTGVVTPPPADQTTPYTRAKGALAASLFKTAGLFAEHLRVNAVAPGPVLVPADPARREPGGETLLPARPTPQDVADAVAFLLETPGITGQILAVDAGQSLLS